MILGTAINNNYIVDGYLCRYILHELSGNNLNASSHVVEV